MLIQSCETLPGVGPTLVKKLAKCGLNSLQDLLFHLPYRYQDRTRVTPVRHLRLNEWSVVAGQITSVSINRGRRPTLSCQLTDQTGTIVLRFFHFNQYQVKSFEQYPTIKVFGEIRFANQQLSMTHPEYQLLDADTPCTMEETLTPIYSTTQGLTQTRLRQLVKQAILLCQDDLKSLEWMSDSQLKQYSLIALPDAIRFLHAPTPDTPLHALENATHPAVRRLVFDELMAQYLCLQRAKQKRATHQGIAFIRQPDWHERFLKQLPFSMTNAQQRVSQDIARDLEKAKPMLRLIQGDVGSGKTVIAALAALQVITNGYQVALMAPTDILSEQHAQTLTPWFTKLGFNVARLSGKMKTSERREILKRLASHECHLVVGTHALFQNEVIFSKLGLVIIDEQHRFGVEQRYSLQQKGQVKQTSPHQLLLTATPIPRTLAMAHFAHIDLSTLDELPPGRTPVKTAVLNQTKREDIINRLQTALSNGRQAYWVCTIIEDSETLQCEAATKTATFLQEQLSNIKVGLVHGRMKATEKDTIMHAFKQGDIHLLVATTVIEVGVNVPNASLMIIENAERLGLSQLHQLRGRVGRGHVESHCLLLYQPPLSLQSTERLQTMRATTDGFIIAEKDMALRGAGEFLGTRQTGYRQFKIADLQRDHALLHVIPKFINECMPHSDAVAQRIIPLWHGKNESFLET